MFTLSLKKQLLNLTRRLSPADTQNLRFNAIKGRNWSNRHKFRIQFSSMDAHYIEYLQEKEFAGGSTTKRNENKGFIDDAFYSCTRMLDNYFKHQKQYRDYSFTRRESRTNARRKYAHNKSLALYELMKGVEENGN